MLEVWNGLELTMELMDHEEVTDRHLPSVSTMRALDESVVHKICSGQIITTLAVAVKELIENSLDAGAKNIEIRLKDFGSSMIEVRDDGPGIDKDNRPVFALKNYTSKIRDFTDVYNLSTYGYRGEALNSLCIIGEVSIVTRHEDDSCGILMVFDRSGCIRDEKPQARMVGTTVFIKDIFSSLPVRRKLLLTNIKKEFVKAVDMVKAYCIVSTGVRIICTNQVAEKLSTVVVTDGISILNNISSAFGIDQVKNLLTVPCHKPDKQILEDFRVADDEENDVSFEGYISSCVRGEGRHLRDRQFVYVNSRPCDYERITRLVNYIFHQYQKRKYPFLFLNLKLSPDTIDVNCSPDKREIILRNETLVLATIKASLLVLYQSVQSASTIHGNKLPSVKFHLENSSLSHVPDSSNVTQVSKTDQRSSKINLIPLEASSSQPMSSKEKDQRNVSQSEKSWILNSSTVPLMQQEDFKSTQNENHPSTSSRHISKGKIVYDDNKRCSNSARRQVVIDVGEIMNVGNSGSKYEKTIELPNSKCLAEKLETNGERKFKASLDPAQNANAEQELRQQIAKEMFTKMEIVGQLNKSFIIVQLESDLFIIDQHAADEIYNFETLMKSTTLPNQRLVMPQQLEMQPTQEMIVIEYMDIFKRNGFEFEVDTSAFPGTRIQLTAVPLSRSRAFGKEDVVELSAMLEECPDVICRPSRVRAMFASRACRKSVMMGTSLTVPIMRNIVDHLGTLDEPWNCPHGRPTMRHLFELNEMKNKSFERTLEQE